MDFSENFERPRSDSAGAVVDAAVGGATGVTAGGRAAVNPSALTVEQLARALGVSADVVRRHVADGAPADFGGRMNLVHYAAWLNVRLAQAGQQEDRQQEDGHGD
jgi:hypothetical protein